jgi:hypothetical protein
MATGTQTHIAWTPWIRDLAEMLETHLVKHQGELKHRHPERLARGRLLHAMIYRKNSQVTAHWATAPWAHQALIAHDCWATALPGPCLTGLLDCRSASPLDLHPTRPLSHRPARRLPCQADSHLTTSAPPHRATRILPCRPARPRLCQVTDPQAFWNPAPQAVRASAPQIQQVTTPPDLHPAGPSGSHPTRLLPCRQARPPPCTHQATPHWATRPPSAGPQGCHPPANPPAHQASVPQAHQAATCPPPTTGGLQHHQTPAPDLPRRHKQDWMLKE